MRDVVALTEELVEIPSVSGDESAVVERVSDLLASTGWTVRRQEVTPGRDNLWASRGRGHVTLSTHLDTVPPHLPFRHEGDRLYGRGTCDAKGIAAAMICAAERLVAEGEDRVDLLFVVGEEAGSDGARAANELPATSFAIINGEPTEGVLATNSKGSLRVLVETSGTAGHSAYPERGESAIDTMVSLLAELVSVDFPTDPEAGDTTVNVGTIRGGVAANVLAEQCTAELLIRLVGDSEVVKRSLDEWAGGRATLRYGAAVPPARFHTLPGFDIGPVSFTTDAPLLDRWGDAVLLFGPGSIHQAHRPEEYVGVEELRESVDTYARLVRALLDERGL
jgi:acetylornithine deacetylase